ncbi:hypothetical protein AXF42_Ash006177 [Apostasia shenzhenica]|uniref:mRNA export factor GLE1 n=1 Tax=Apostasia shenzhenica TaxID=1088818 RepID=A0A2I0B0G5_9ASPA|nr:hypothetical protein AXF42_Ash006177 [Apostasia shenzhenica]
MGYVKLELRCPRSSPMVSSADPEPLWTLDNLLEELSYLELQLGGCDSSPSPLKNIERKNFSEGKVIGRESKKPFVMCVSEDDVEEFESEDESITTGTRFYLSDDDGSDDEICMAPATSHLMEKKSLEEGILFELEYEHQLMVKDQLRNTLSALELSQKNEIEKSSIAMQRLEKYAEARREMDRRLDKQYQRRIAEVLDTHLSIIQRDHEQRSQIEERRIRDDAAVEEAKRKEKALVDERLHQEQARAEAEARLNAIKQIEAQKAALEAEKRAVKEAAEMESRRLKEAAAADAAKTKSESKSTEQKKESYAEIIESPKQGSSNQKKLSSGIRVIASEAALKAEAAHLAIFNEVSEQSRVVPQKEIDRHGRQMYKYIKQIGGTVENVRTKAHALVQLIRDPALPLPVSTLIFANKVVSLSENPTGSFDKGVFACGWVILLVASQVPNVMDLVLAEFHRACIYTIPKHLQASDLSSQTKDYWIMVGYREEDGKIESTSDFLNRVESCVKLYAAMIQTEIDGVEHPHGLKEGWAWLAMFLNHLPANRATAVALEAFLKMAGFALLRRYKSQFMKVLNLISKRFLPALKQRGKAVHDIVAKLEQYLDDKLYLREPVDRHLQGSSLSKFFD